MTTFADQPFDVRLNVMGDEAESMFTEVWPKGWAVWGLRRPPIKVASLPTKIRYAPDFITSDGFVECMGFGQRQLLRLKVEKLVNLLQWDQEMHTRLFVWDGKNHRYQYLNMGQVVDAIAGATPGKFPEGKATWDIPAEELGGEWVST